MRTHNYLRCRTSRTPDAGSQASAALRCQPAAVDSARDSLKSTRTSAAYTVTPRSGLTWTCRVGGHLHTVRVAYAQALRHQEWHVQVVARARFICTACPRLQLNVHALAPLALWLQALSPRKAVLTYQIGNCREQALALARGLAQQALVDWSATTLAAVSEVLAECDKSRKVGALISAQALQLAEAMDRVSGA